MSMLPPMDKTTISLANVGEPPAENIYIGAWDPVKKLETSRDIAQTPLSNHHARQRLDSSPLGQNKPNIHNDKSCNEVEDSCKLSCHKQEVSFNSMLVKRALNKLEEKICLIGSCIGLSVKKSELKAYQGFSDPRMQDKRRPACLLKSTQANLLLVLALCILVVCGSLLTVECVDSSNILHKQANIGFHQEQNPSLTHIATNSHQSLPSRPTERNHYSLDDEEDEPLPTRQSSQDDNASAANKDILTPGQSVPFYAAGEEFPFITVEKMKSGSAESKVNELSSSLESNLAILNNPAIQNHTNQTISNPLVAAKGRPIVELPSTLDNAGDKKQQSVESSLSQVQSGSSQKLVFTVNGNGEELPPQSFGSTLQEQIMKNFTRETVPYPRAELRRSDGWWAVGRKINRVGQPATATEEVSGFDVVAGNGSNLPTSISQTSRRHERSKDELDQTASSVNQQQPPPLTSPSPMKPPSETINERGYTFDSDELLPSMTTLVPNLSSSSTQTMPPVDKSTSHDSMVFTLASEMERTKSQQQQHQHQPHRNVHHSSKSKLMVKKFHPTQKNNDVDNQNNDINKIISDWPKKADGLTSKLVLSGKPRGSLVKFSKLLSSQPDTTTQANQPEEAPSGLSHYWDAKELPGGSIVLKPHKLSPRAPTESKLARSHNSDGGFASENLLKVPDRSSGQIGNFSIKVSIQPMAPVYAKARYTSSIVAAAGRSGVQKAKQAVDGYAGPVAAPVVRPADDNYGTESSENRELSATRSPNNRPSPTVATNTPAHVQHTDFPSKAPSDDNPTGGLSDHSSGTGGKRKKSSESVVSAEYKEDHLGRTDQLQSITSEYQTNYATQFKGSLNGGTVESKSDHSPVSSEKSSKMVDLNEKADGVTVNATSKSRRGSSTREGAARGGGKSRLNQRDLSHHLPHLHYSGAGAAHHLFHIPVQMVQISERTPKQQQQLSQLKSDLNRLLTLNTISRGIGKINGNGKNDSTLPAAILGSNGNNLSNPTQKTHESAAATVPLPALSTSSSIVRSGTILPHPNTSQQNLQLQRSLVPAAMALLAAQAHGADTTSGQRHLGALLAGQRQLTNILTPFASSNNIQPRDSSTMTAFAAPSSSPLKATVGLGQATFSSVVGGGGRSGESMLATANQLGVSHLGPQMTGHRGHLSIGGTGPGESESGYKNFPHFQDYHDRTYMAPSSMFTDYSTGDSSGPNGGSAIQPNNNVNVDERVRSQYGGGGSGSGVAASGGGIAAQTGGDYQPNGQPDSSVYADRQMSSPPMSSQDPYLMPPPPRGAPHQNGSTNINSQSNGVTANGPEGQSVYTNSRSSISDVYMKPEHKSSSGEGSSEQGLLVGANSLRNSVDPFEEMANGLSTSEYERDLADLDEEFNRHAGFPRARPASGSLVSDSLVSLSPERYEAGQRYTRRPTGASYSDYPVGVDYLTTAGSMSSIIPRAYPRTVSPWAAAGAGSQSYATDTSELWADPGYDYTPLASFLNPSSHYSYRWRPRFSHYHHHHHPAGSLIGPAHASQHHQRLASAYASGPSAATTASYLAASASEQPSYNLIPSYASAVPTETVSFTLSPLAAAAAAAATALAAADKSRHHHHGHHAWTFTLPRLTSALAAGSSSLGEASGSTSSSGGGTSGSGVGLTGSHGVATGGSVASAAASNIHAASLLPAGSPLHGAYTMQARPSSPYIFGSVPLYAISAAPPRHQASGLLTTQTAGGGGSGAPSALMPTYFQATTANGAPALFAYRPTSVLHPAGPFLTAASLPYPLRVPLAPVIVPQHPSLARPLTTGVAGLRPSANSASALGQLRPIYADLQFAETKSKSSPSNGGSASTSDSPKSISKGGSSLSAIARNLSKKMFGSGSLNRPQHVAPPAGFELFTGSGSHQQSRLSLASSPATLAAAAS